MGCCVMVAVDNAAFKFDKLYSYAVPAELEPYAKIGARVAVPFGGGDAPRVGVILRFDTETPPEKLKQICDIEKNEPQVTEELAELILYLKEYTFCTYYDALKTVLPKNSRMVLERSGEAALKSASKSHVETVYGIVPTDVAPRLTKKQAEVYALLQDGALSYSQIDAAIKVSRGVIALMTERGILQKSERVRDAEIYEDYVAADDFSLSAQQQAAYDAIVSFARDRGKPNTTLLYGVTSSGKTLVYSALVKAAVEKGKSALLLVPEITLATQLIYRFKAMFGERVGIIHSALSPTERQVQWQRIRDGEYDIVIGTRSAVFSPLGNIGVIIVDEEQEQTYYSEQSPRYSACAVAGFRAKRHHAHVLLASATPSLESFYRAKLGDINYVELTERYGKMPLPEVKIIDMRGELLAGNTLGISQYLKDEIDKRLLKKEQCILLLNRRGYQTVTLCSDCKSIIKCDSCDSAMVYHKKAQRLICHYCAKSRPVPEACPICGGELRHTGIGTQKLEEQLELLFPGARIARLDVDAVSRKNTASNILRDFAAGAYDIVVGTQMVAKGLDFKNVTLVGVLNIDQMLLMPDFRANERAFAMLTQVVGRSGRGVLAGQAVVQTIDPENPIIQLAAKQDYRTFYADEIVMRKMNLYPPFCSICTLGVLAPREETAKRAANDLLSILRESVTKSGQKMPVKVLGPSPMRVAFVNDTYRYKLTVKCKNNRAFRELIRHCLMAFTKKYPAQTARVFVDFGQGAD